MARALIMKRTIVPLPERARYVERLQKRKAYYASARCHFWVFEEAALNGAFIEFTEAPDRATLQAALAEAPDQVLDANRIYQEISLS
ncbi:MAG TPA: hypothetical protein VE861_10140 [Gemmatimonadaceae bacterium]|nr:hypothetical protein [Gemmatimonadaceae bacterium]